MIARGTTDHHHHDIISGIIVVIFLNTIFFSVEQSLFSFLCLLFLVTGMSTQDIGQSNMPCF